MKTYNRYENNIDHTWYDSSNIVYSQCYDKGDTKSVKIVFKGGRTYLYRGVSMSDYIIFRDSESTGEAANRNIVKKYQAVRVEDVPLDEIQAMKERFIDEDKKLNEEMGNLKYHVEFNNNTGEFRIKYEGRPIFEGVEGQVSIFRLFNSMGIKFSMSELEENLSTNNDFEKQKLLDAVAEKQDETITEENNIGGKPPLN